MSEPEYKLQWRTNNGYDTILLLKDGQRSSEHACSTDTLREFLCLESAPEDWDDQGSYPADPDSYGELVAEREGYILTVGDQELFDSRMLFWKIPRVWNVEQHKPNGQVEHIGHVRAASKGDAFEEAYNQWPECFTSELSPKLAPWPVVSPWASCEGVAEPVCENDDSGEDD